MLPARVYNAITSSAEQAMDGLKSMENMTSSQTENSGKPVSGSEEIVDRFLDAIWMERGLSANTLGAYRADLMTLGRRLSESNIAIERAEKSDLLEFIAGRVESGAKPRSTARQLSSFRRFFRYIMREGLRDTDPTADIEMPRIGRSLPKTLTEDEVDSLLQAPNVPHAAFQVRQDEIVESAGAHALPRPLDELDILCAGGSVYALLQVAGGAHFPALVRQAETATLHGAAPGAEYSG